LIIPPVRNSETFGADFVAALQQDLHLASFQADGTLLAGAELREGQRDGNRNRALLAIRVSSITHLVWSQDIQGYKLGL